MSAETNDPQQPVKPAASSPEKWRTAIAHLKDIKEVLAAITAIGVAVIFALSYFATSRALNCFKTESRKSNELVQTILQINSLTASWESLNLSVRQFDVKRNGLSVQAGSAEYDGILKDLVKTQAQAEAVTTELKAARDRKISLERGVERCE